MEYNIWGNDVTTPPTLIGCPSKRRFRAGLVFGGMIAMGVPPPVHEGIYWGLGINGIGAVGSLLECNV